VETDDYASDVEFGKWLKDRRVAAGLTIEQAGKDGQISVQRLKSLEMGFCERGITRTEATRLCALYRMELKDLLSRAGG
jgi:hypothetical protein